MPIMSRTLMSFAALCCMAAATTQAQEWPRFRGEQGAGTSETTGLPATWSESENIVWKLEMPGYGASSPILWGEKLFITCYTGYGQGGEDGEKADLHGQTLCINRHTGETIWDMSIPTFRGERQYEGFIREHGYSSATPATDGNHVVSFFGASGVVAYDMEGNELWRTSVGTKTHNFGSGTSPVIFGSLVIINASVESDALVALNLADGSEVWRTEDIPRSWNTPVIVQPPGGGEPELVVNMQGVLKAYNPRTGEELWRCEAIPDYICPSVITHDGIVYAIGGRRSQCLAVRTGGRGDVTESHKLWQIDVGSNVPSPVYHEGHLYWMNHRGLVYCVDADSGEIVTQKRTSAGKTYASVTYADGRLYAVSRENGAFVFEATPEMPELAHNEIAGDDTIFNGSPTVADGRMYLRSDAALYCIGKQ